MRSIRSFGFKAVDAIDPGAGGDIGNALTLIGAHRVLMHRIEYAFQVGSWMAARSSAVLPAARCPAASDQINDTVATNDALPESVSTRSSGSQEIGLLLNSTPACGSTLCLSVEVLHPLSNKVPYELRLQLTTRSKYGTRPQRLVHAASPS